MTPDILKILRKREAIFSSFKQYFVTCYLLLDSHVEIGTIFLLRDKRSRDNESRLYL